MEEEYSYEKRKLKKYLGNNLYNILKAYNCIIAGGSILSIFSNKEINDIDVYFRSKEDLSDFLHEEMEGHWIIAYTKKAFLFKYEKMEVQAIYFKYFDSPEDIFNTFDFTVCMAAFDFKSESFVLHSDFLRHNVSKVLKFNSNTAYPIVSALRVSKYKGKGFTISKPEYLKIILTILNLKIENYEQLKDQMGGMYGENYDSLLETKDGEEFDLSKVIDNIGKIGETDFEYKLTGCKTEINNFDDFVCEVTGCKIKYFEYDGVLYRYRTGVFEKINDENITDNYEKCEVKEAFKFPLVLYKYVKQDNDGRLWSYYDKNYEWHIGINYPKNKENGLYASKPSDLDGIIYANQNDKVCLECEIESFDDIIITGWFSDVNTYKKIKAIRLVPKDEVERMIGHPITESKSDCDDDALDF